MGPAGSQPFGNCQADSPAAADDNRSFSRKIKDSQRFLLTSGISQAKKKYHALKSEANENKKQFSPQRTQRNSMPQDEKA
jgi:hypothetical protein